MLLVKSIDFNLFNCILSSFNSVWLLKSMLEKLLLYKSKKLIFTLFSRFKLVKPKLGTLIDSISKFFEKSSLVIVSQGSIIPFSISSDQSGLFPSIDKTKSFELYSVLTDLNSLKFGFYEGSL